MLPKLVITDIDGVWTDGGMYYDETGNEFKKFNTSDSAGVIFCKKLNIPVAIITGENAKSAKARANKLKIEFFFAGITDKLACANDLCGKLGLTLNEIAFIGDDLTDIALLQKVGLSACPSNASEYVKNICKWNLPVPGGQGAFRAFIERILLENDKLDEVISSFMN
jgi:3-deoxy-D-manno-octulosonate 8-phosphate phosphatase (KDO 8-P phosphatase)